MSAAKLDTFFRWWGDELLAMVPMRIRRWSLPQHRVAIRMQAQALTLAFSSASPGTQPERVELTDQAEAKTRIAALLAKQPAWQRQIVLLCAAEQVLSRVVELPLATEENLYVVAGFELERLTPFKANDVAYDVRVISRDLERQTLKVELIVTPRRPLQRDLERLDALGLVVQAVGVETDQERAPPHFDLLPAERRAAATGVDRWRILQIILAAVIALLVLVIVAWPIWQKRERVAQLLPLVERAKLGAEVAERSSRELERRVEEYNFALNKRHANVPVIDVIERVSELIPMSGYATQLDVKATKTGRELSVQGEVAQGTKIIEPFEQSGLVQNTTLKSPLTRGAAPNSERFHVAGDLVPRPLPPTVPDDQLMAKSTTGSKEGAASTAGGDTPVAASTGPMPAAAPTPAAPLNVTPGSAMPPPARTEVKPATPVPTTPVMPPSTPPAKAAGAVTTAPPSTPPPKAAGTVTTAPPTTAPKPSASGTLPSAPVTATPAPPPTTPTKGAGTGTAVPVPAPKLP
jgi:general secretion pathway protein L